MTSHANIPSKTRRKPFGTDTGLYFDNVGVMVACYSNGTSLRNILPLINTTEAQKVKINAEIAE